MPQYEMVYIVRPDLEPDAVQAVVGRIGQRVTEQGGTVDYVEVWGKRRLASSLGKFREGVYVMTRFTIDSAHIPEFKRLTRIMEEVMRLLIVEAEGPLPAPKAAPAPEVMGYGLTGHMTTVDLNKDVERGLLTTVCIHAAYAGATGGLTGFDPTSAALKAFVDKCHAHGARVVLSVANFSTPDTKVLLDSHQDALVAAIHAKVTAAGLDGVSLDLENVTDTTRSTTLGSRPGPSSSTSRYVRSSPRHARVTIAPRPLPSSASIAFR